MQKLSPENRPSVAEAALRFRQHPVWAHVAVFSDAAVQALSAGYGVEDNGIPS